ncbi:hypothetical protein [Ralstonia pickettii]|uniref:hypothetical protein n=1 Tax=Ralstonia pickettii TaxID=329 RepID=UPI00081897B2|nr:hypothetical protein [Ralstonia pickettii]OCS48529.1 hypothetical protein BEK67_21175 [Ralstonia pickettii]
MENLIIRRLQEEDGSMRWYAFVTNTDVQWAFRGVTEAEQFPLVQLLSTAMRDGTAETLEHLPDCLAIVEEDAENVFSDLFMDTNQLIYEDAVIYGTGVEDLALASEEEFLQQAGTLLLDAVLV